MRAALGVRDYLRARWGSTACRRTAAGGVLGRCRAQDRARRPARAPARVLRPRAVRGKGDELAHPRLPARRSGHPRTLVRDRAAASLSVSRRQPPRAAGDHGRALEHARRVRPRVVVGRREPPRELDGVRGRHRALGGAVPARRGGAVLPRSRSRDDAAGALGVGRVRGVRRQHVHRRQRVRGHHRRPDAEDHVGSLLGGAFALYAIRTTEEEGRESEPAPALIGR